MNNKILKWFLTHPVITVLIIIFTGGVLGLYVIQPINDTLNLKYYFTEADLLLISSICFVLGIYCVSTIKTKGQKETSK